MQSKKLLHTAFATALIAVIALFSPATATAQVKIGYFSNEAALKAAPEYETAQQDLQRLREQYEKEMKRAENDFNAKYEDFLDNVNSLAPSIRRKRQTELQQFMEGNIRFREEARRLLRQAEKDAMAPIQQRVNNTVRLIAAEQGYDIILNTDSNAVPFISSVISEDINALVQTALAK